jgi:hypothetical protein
MDESGSPEAHPLFPASEDDDDDEIKLVSFISVSRIENGKQYLAPRQRRADELRSLDQLHAEFGGGEYVLTAFHNGRISTRRKLNLPGKSKPMFDEGINSAEESRAAAQAAPIPVDPMAAMMGGSGGGLMGLIMMMMQQMMQQQAAAASSQTQMFIAMMQGNQQSSSEEKTQARAELQANIERERISSERTMALMREVMQTKSSGGTGDDFYKGVEFMRAQMGQHLELLKNQKGGDETDWGPILETIGQVIQGVSMLKGGLPEGQVASVAEAVAQ